MSSGPVELAPQLAVPGHDPLTHRHGVTVLLEQAARLEVHELAGDVDEGDVEVVLALAVAQPLPQLPGLGVDEVCRERPGIPAEERVGERDVAPPEAGEVQPHEQHRQGVDEPGRGALAQRLAVERPVGKGELEVPRDEAGVQLPPVGADPTADDPEGLHARHPEAVEVAEQLVLAAGQVRLDLLDGEDATRQPHEPHDVPGDTSGECGEDVLRPLLERDAPRQVEQRRVGPGGGDLQGHRHGSSRGCARWRGGRLQETRDAPDESSSGASRVVPVVGRLSRAWRRTPCRRRACGRGSGTRRSSNPCPEPCGRRPGR